MSVERKTMHAMTTRFIACFQTVLPDCAGDKVPLASQAEAL
jgi:hypothetical protein